ncbi:uncharacterized protein LOC21383677 isoform X2 [Morus notabilis]|uniref:uncharacterized protein LOC21383677 isoform X2 n=1 Tax=Morus notabilis TaxID=981085 RepID=UPI000CED7848|nr:uncharacterized protein LOC21383677 isoform X2 [Morus notabilis]
MAIRTSCFLNLRPSSPSFAPKTTSQVSCKKVEEKLGRKCPSIVGVASVIIGLELVSSVMMASSELGQQAIAQEMPFLQKPNHEAAVRVAKWSDRRMCPPWHTNSLESIVPENLPRPSARRRWESVGHATHAPPLKVDGVRTSGDCFSM